mmetsp:Transcript_754/g.2510  ORF Transcript_754/g.2510 Transcript_754/m.2510 type:complete len:210 (-) Transcript_754:22-651(-)
MKSLDAALDSFGRQRVEVRWLPYIIDPGTAPEGEEYLAYNRRRWGSDGWTSSLRNMGERVGAPFSDWRWWPNTLKAHCLVHLAETKGLASSAAKAALFEALYEEGANVSDEEVLAQLAEEKLGLQREEVLEYLRSGRGEMEVLSAVQAGQQVVQGGVPFFVVGPAQREGPPYGFSGAQPTQTFTKLFEECAEGSGSSGADTAEGSGCNS